MSLLHSFASLPAQVACPAAPAGPWYRETWFSVLVAVAVIVLPFWVGQRLAQRFRMADYGWRIGLVLFSLIGGIVVCIAGWPPRLGIDLSGGVILVYELDQS